MHSPRTTFPAPLLALVAVSVVAIIVPFAHVLTDLYSLWNLQPEYSHGLIIPVLSAFLVWRQRADLKGMPLTGSWLGVLLIAVGLALRYVGEFSTMHTLEHYAFLLVLYGLILALTGPAIVRRLWMPLLMLLFAVPLPSFLTSTLSLQLQLLSSKLGVWFMQVAGLSVLLQGNVIDLGSYQLEVAEACSGLRYLFPLMTLAFIMVFLFQAPLWKRTLLFLSSIPITVLMNSLRIAFIGVTVDRWGGAMAEGVLHDFEGWVVFMFSTGALILTAFALNRIGNADGRLKDVFTFNRATPAEPRAATVQPTSSRRNTISLQFAAAAVLVLVGAVADAAAPKPGAIIPARLEFDQFPVRIDDWIGHRDVLEKQYLDRLKLDDYILADYRETDTSAVNLYLAYYQSQDETRAIHSPHDCIPGGGWEIQKLETRLFTPAQGPAFRVNRAIIQFGSTRQVVYYWFQERGRHLTNEYAVRWYLFWDALTRHRTDGALVRFVAALPQNNSEADVDARILKLAVPVQERLSRYVPD